MHALAFVLGYVAVDWVSFIQPVLKLGITPWNPQTGVALAYLLWRGPKWAPVVAVGAFMAEVVVRDSPAPTLVLAASSALIALVYGGLAHFLAARPAGEETRVLSGAVRFAAGVVVASLMVSGGYVALFTVSGVLPDELAIESIAQYWVGDVNGILMLTPLMLAAADWRQGWRSVRARWTEVLAQAALVALFVWLIFGLQVSDRLRFFYPLFVPIIWIAARWGAKGAMLGALAIQVGLVVAIEDLNPVTPLIELQFLMVTLCSTGLLLGTVVTERANALARVAAGEAELRALLAAAPDAVITVSPGGGVITTNAVARHLFALDDESAAPPPLHELLPEVSLRAPEGRRSVAGVRRDGSSFPAEIAWAQLESPAQPGWLVIVRDATERQRAQAEARERDRILARAMRFAVAGELASALAHELNQPITALVSYLRASEILAAPLAGQDGRLDATLGKAVREAMRASDVLRRLRDFYQGGKQASDDVDIRACCASVARAVDARLQAVGAVLEVDVAADVATLRADGTHLEIVLYNLVSNAVDALAVKRSAGRRIAIRVRGEHDRTVLSVEDDGDGVAPEALAGLFEPFNTTKPDGMGLGLAISRSLVAALGGELTYERGARLGGACFRVALARQASAAAADTGT